MREDENYGLLATFPRPDETTLPDYYKSEEYISHTDSRHSLFDRSYQWVKNYMVRKKLNWISSLRNESGYLLDIGAGTGDFLKEAKKRGWNVSGTEPNEKARSLAKQKDIQLQQDTGVLPAGKFDVISMWHVLEHVSDLEAQIEELQRLLKKDGLLVIAVPNYKSLDAKKYKENWAAYDVPRHLYHFSRESISKIFSEKGFRLVEIKPLLFDSFYVSLLSEKYRSGKVNSINGFITGLKSNLRAKNTGEYSSLIYFLQKI